MEDPDIDIPPYASPRLRARGVDTETKRMAIIAGGLGVGIIALALIWSGIHTGLGPPPVIKPPAGPMRTAPINPGGLQVPGAHEQIMSGQVASGPPELAPASPAPDFSKLDQEAAAAKPAPPAPLTPKQAPPAVASALPLPPPAPSPDHAATTPAPAGQSILPPITPPTQATGSGPYAVQLGALDSMAKANQAWQTLVARVPDILGSQKPVVVPGTVHGKVFYRLRLVGFANAAAAGNFCDRLKSRGVTCYIPK
ncbi:SPOR domain-containing protein [Acidiphilium sp. PA]|uniref:SPOR domain-containing protein n=1 Tax=Acidiphilium sp. PA TaxID=2871705 RepID=UPI002242D55F|nr:SPOR domain-containing protein [Acidiphilium sp. PA]MCW8306106.1 SPOR domain-containing protein [Acidiphilium sp. PA]